MKIAKQFSLDNPRSMHHGPSQVIHFARMTDFNFDPHLKVIRDGHSLTGRNPGIDLPYRRQASQILPTTNQVEGQRETPIVIQNLAKADTSTSADVQALTKKRISFQRVPLAELNESLDDEQDKSE